MLYVDDLLLWKTHEICHSALHLCLHFAPALTSRLDGRNSNWVRLSRGSAGINFSAGCFTLPEAKRLKLLSQLQECLGHTNLSLASSWTSSYASFHGFCTVCQLCAHGSAHSMMTCVAHWVPTLASAPLFGQASMTPWMRSCTSYAVHPAPASV